MPLHGGVRVRSLLSRPFPAVATGVLSGTVADQTTAAAVGQGWVELWNTALTAKIAEQQIGGGGSYTFSNVAVGDYRAIYQPPPTHSVGDSELDSVPLTISAGQTTTLNFTAQPAIIVLDPTLFAAITDIMPIGNVGTSGIFRTPSAGQWGFGVFDYVMSRNHDLLTGGAAGSITLDPDGASGENVVTVTWNARPTGNGSNYVKFEGRYKPLPLWTTGKVYARLHEKLSAGFNVGGAGNTSSALEYKYLWFQVDSVQHQSPSRFEFMLDNQGTNPAGLLTMKQQWVTTNASEPAGQGGFFGTDGSGGRPPQYNIGSESSGQWNTHVFAINKLASALGDTSSAWWLNGTKRQEMSGSFLAGDTIGGDVNEYLWFELGANMNNGPDVSQTRKVRWFGLYRTRCSTRAGLGF